MYAVLRKYRLGVAHLVEDRAGRKYRHALAAVYGKSLAYLKVIYAVVYPSLTAAPEAHIAGPGVCRNGFCRLGSLNKVAGTEHRNSGQRAHDRNILCRLVAHSERAVNEPAAHADDLDVRAVICAVVAYLFEATKSGKVPYRVCKDRFALKRHARGDGRHILLGNAGVNELVGKLLPEGLQHAEPEVARDELNVTILLCQFDKSIYKGISHFYDLVKYAGCQPTDVV